MHAWVPIAMERCCDRCRHADEAPCPDLVACRTAGPLCHEDDACAAWHRERTARLLRTRPTRPVVYVGTGTCGLGAGADRTLDAVHAWLATADIAADVVEVGCVGLCSAEPLVDVQLPGRPRLVFAEVRADDVPAVLAPLLAFGAADDARAAADDVPRGRLLGQLAAVVDSPGGDQTPWPDVPSLADHPFFALQTRRVLASCGVADPRSLDEYLARGGFRAFAAVLHGQTPAEVCAAVERSGLRGRGGGGFPTGRKWRFALGTAADRKYLICNADEGDPGAFMDRAVIEGDPYRLVEGLAIAAYAIGATKAYVYIRAEYPLAIARLEHALAETRRMGLLGRNVLDSGLELEVVVKQGAGAFVCGEETALIHSVEGKRGMPRPRPPYPAVAGLFGRPTVINNVETLANLPGVLAPRADGADPALAHAALGTATSKGTKVFALSGKVARTGLVEVAMGTSLRCIVEEIGGGVPNGRAFKAVQIGGPSGGCIPRDHLDTPVDYESLLAVGAMMGSGGLVVMDEDNCMVDVARYFMEFIGRESCGKCIPCREGTRRMLEILEAIVRGRRSEEGRDALHRMHGVLDIERLAEVIRDASLCGLGQSAPNPVLSTLRWFRDEYEAHVFERRCPAGVCQDLLRYTIDPDVCTGCTLCAKTCPSNAILGARKSAHHVVDERCLGCGECLTVCKVGAVKAA